MKYLVIVDMQNDFITGPLGTSEAVVARNNLVQKLKNLDPYGIEKIILTQDTHYTFYSETHEGKYLPIPHCIEKTEGWNIDSEVMSAMPLEPQIIQKSTFGSFYGLPTALIGRYDFYSKFDTIEICGLCTDICVISNALILRSALPDATIQLDSSCCAGSTPARHQAALEVMRSCHIEVI